MREELRKLKEDVRKSSEERTINKRVSTRYVPKEGIRSSDNSRSASPSVVMRPPLGGRSTAIQEGPKQTQEEYLDTVNRQIDALNAIRARMYQMKDTQRMDKEVIAPSPRCRKEPFDCASRKTSSSSLQGRREHPKTRVLRVGWRIERMDGPRIMIEIWTTREISRDGTR